MHLSFGFIIFDVYTTHSAREVLTYIQNFSKQQFGFTPELDMNEFSVMFYNAYVGFYVCYCYNTINKKESCFV